MYIHTGRVHPHWPLLFTSTKHGPAGCYCAHKHIQSIHPHWPSWFTSNVHVHVQSTYSTTCNLIEVDCMYVNSPQVLAQDKIASTVSCPRQQYSRLTLRGHPCCGGKQADLGSLHARLFPTAGLGQVGVASTHQLGVTHPSSSSSLFSHGCSYPPYCLLLRWRTGKTSLTL